MHLVGQSDIDVNRTVGILFSVFPLPCPKSVSIRYFLAAENVWITLRFCTLREDLEYWKDVPERKFQNLILPGYTYLRITLGHDKRIQCAFSRTLIRKRASNIHKSGLTYNFEYHAVGEGSCPSVVNTASINTSIFLLNGLNLQNRGFS
ncbi:hypothetical protein CEXT_549631 [Caerostris extrusa]|uniref:Uncharacterized protein n=1 Tax=Caerostris extrusa TaxID=172846 RepID=A0AAV4Q1I5_CAEEX|nr:hypothetical protein CEXT_549631 [Caerostris extrusa]